MFFALFLNLSQALKKLLFFSRFFIVNRKERDKRNNSRGTEASAVNYLSFGAKIYKTSSTRQKGFYSFITSTVTVCKLQVIALSRHSINFINHTIVCLFVYIGNMRCCQKTSSNIWTDYGQD